MSNYTECMKMRESRVRGNREKKYFSCMQYDADVAKALLDTVERICSVCDLKSRVTKEILGVLLRNGVSEAEILKRVNNVYNQLDNYGYGDYKNKLLEENITLLNHTTLDLNHTLLITSAYGFDEVILTAPTMYSRLTDKDIYALTEELKENNVDVTFENVQKLYIEFSNKGELRALRSMHPLTNKELFRYTVLYNQKLNDKTLSKSKGVK